MSANGFPSVPGSLEKFLGDRSFLPSAVVGRPGSEMWDGLYILYSLNKGFYIEGH